jgi:IS5 family transposase
VRLAQKDTDARWAVKNKETHYGYKDHVKVDADSKLIVKHSVTAASVHDSRKFVGLVDADDNRIHGDSAFVGKELHAELLRRYPWLDLQIHEKGRSHP